MMLKLGREKWQSHFKKMRDLELLKVIKNWSDNYA